jgi:hypothetical protein
MPLSVSVHIGIINDERGFGTSYYPNHFDWAKLKPLERNIRTYLTTFQELSEYPN